MGANRIIEQKGYLKLSEWKKPRNHAKISIQQPGRAQKPPDVTPDGSSFERDD
jgi:hypothetical protein